MFRVAMISPLPPEKSGEAPYAARLIKNLVSTGKVRVIAIGGKEANPVSPPNSMIETLSIWDGRSIMYPFQLLGKIAEKQCSLAHVQFGPYGRVYGGFFGEIMLFLLILLRLTGVKTTMTLHSTWMPWQVVERVKKYRIVGRFSILAGPIFRFFMKVLNWSTDTVQLSTVRENSTLRRVFLREYGFNPKKVLEIPHPCVPPGGKPDQQHAARLLGLADKKVILMFGFIRPGKGFDTALRAISAVREKHPDAFLLVAGRPQGREGDRHLEHLHDLVGELAIEENIRFDTRFIPDDEVPVYFSASTLLLIPYTESVGASGPIHNYAGYGIPILASDVGFHNRESIGGNLFLFSSGDPRALAEKLMGILSQPSKLEERSRMQIEYAKSENWTLAAKRTLLNYQKTFKMTR